MTPTTPQTELEKAIEAYESLKQIGAVHWSIENIAPLYVAAKRIPELEQTINYCCATLKDCGLDEAAPLEKLVRSIVVRNKELEARVKELEKALKNSNDAAEKLEGMLKELEEQFNTQHRDQLSQYKTAYKEAVEALEHTTDCFMTTNCEPPIIASVAPIQGFISGKTYLRNRQILLNPLAIALKKGESV